MFFLMARSSTVYLILLEMLLQLHPLKLNRNMSNVSRRCMVQENITFILFFKMNPRLLMLSRNVNNSKQKQPPSVLYYTDCPGLLQPRINNNLIDSDINNNCLTVIVLHYKPLVS